MPTLGSVSVPAVSLGGPRPPAARTGLQTWWLLHTHQWSGPPPSLFCSQILSHSACLEPQLSCRVRGCYPPPPGRQCSVAAPEADPQSVPCVSAVRACQPHPLRLPVCRGWAGEQVPESLTRAASGWGSEGCARLFRLGSEPGILLFLKSGFTEQLIKRL